MPVVLSKRHHVQSMPDDLWPNGTSVVKTESFETVTVFFALTFVFLMPVVSAILLQSLNMATCPMFWFCNRFSLKRRCYVICATKNVPRLALALSLVSITRQTPRPRHRNKAIIRLSSHPSL